MGVALRLDRRLPSSAQPIPLLDRIASLPAQPRWQTVLRAGFAFGAIGLALLVQGQRAGLLTRLGLELPFRP